MPALVIRSATAVALAVALLSSCSGSDDDVAKVSPIPAVAESAAATTASTVVKAALEARADVSAGGKAARQKSFTGASLESANAFAKTLPARTSVQKADAQLATTGIKVLAVSRMGETPRQIIAQTTVVKGGGAVLVLLMAPDASTDFKVAALTPMLRDSTLEAFDAKTLGSAAVGAGAGLVAKPDAVLSAFAASVAYPKPTETKQLTKDPLSEQVRDAAAAQARSIGSKGTFAQVHEPKSVVGGLRLAGGSGAIVFADLVRKDSIALREAVKLPPAKEVTLLSGLKQITTEAQLTTNEAVAIVIPTSGAARVVGYSDQLVDATGR